MSLTLTDALLRLRQDLKDTDAANYRWTDTELTRHLQHALLDFSYDFPWEQKTAFASVAGSRDVVITSILATLIHIFAVEYPKDLYPRSYVRFSFFNDTLTMLIDSPPAASVASAINVYWGAVQYVTTASSLMPAHENIVIRGAEGYALVEYASYTINRVNVSGEASPRDFRIRGEQLLRWFHQDSKKVGYRNRVRISQLYPSALPVKSQTIDWGP